jgi:hypothetical protein
MTMVVRWVGVLIAVGFMALSLLINWRYGVRLGRDGIDQWIFSSASLLADVAKAATPFFMALAFARRQWPAGMVALAFWLICTCYSLLCVAGFMESNHAVVSGSLASQQETEGHLRLDLRRKQSEREALGSQSASTVVAAKIQQARPDRRWTGSSHCAAPRDAADRKFCAGLAALEIERVQASEAERLEREAVSLRQQIAALAGVTTLSHGDPRVDFLSRFVSWQKASIEAFLALLLLALLEIGSGLGLYMAVGHGTLRSTGAINGGASKAATINDMPITTTDDTHRIEQTRLVATRRVVTRVDGTDRTDSDTGPGGEGETTSTDVGDVAKYARACLQPSPCNTVTIAAMFAAYRAWCRQTQAVPLESQDFAVAMIELAAAVDVRTVARGADHILFEVDVHSPAGIAATTKRSI